VPDISKEEILGNIQRLNATRREKVQKLYDAKQKLYDRDHQLPAWKELETLNDKATLAAARLNEQRDADDTWKDRKSKVKECEEDLNAVDDSLSNMLLLYTIRTEKKAVHANPDEPEQIDREIKIIAKLGKKVPANLSLFDAPE
jgi:predicted nuclease with TOPRIM domain